MGKLLYSLANKTFIDIVANVMDTDAYTEIDIQNRGGIICYYM